MQPGEKSHKMHQDCKWKTPGAPSLWILEEILVTEQFSSCLLHQTSEMVGEDMTVPNVLVTAMFSVTLLQLFWGTNADNHRFIGKSNTCLTARTLAFEMNKTHRKGCFPDNTLSLQHAE